MAVGAPFSAVNVSVLRRWPRVLQCAARPRSGPHYELIRYLNLIWHERRKKENFPRPQAHQQKVFYLQRRKARAQFRRRKRAFARSRTPARVGALGETFRDLAANRAVAPVTKMFFVITLLSREWFDAARRSHAMIQIQR